MTPSRAPADGPVAVRPPVTGRTSRSERSALQFGQRWLIMLLVTMLLLFVYMTHIFFVPVVVAAVVTTLTYPLQTLLVIRLGGRRGLAALLSCAIIMLGC